MHQRDATSLAQLIRIRRAKKMAVAKLSEADNLAQSESNKVMMEVVAPNLSCPSCGYFFKGE